MNQLITIANWPSILDSACLLFHHLREKVFGLSEEQYQNQWTKKLRPIDGLGFSGSLFFFTDDKSFILKSIGRRFEYAFLYQTLMNPLGVYYHESPNTLLSRITDILYFFDHRLGSYLGVSPSHYIVMLNVMEGLDTENGCRKWDLKPQNFFEPIWDLVPDDMKTEAAKSGLADELDEKIVLSQDQKNEPMCILHPPTFRLIYIMKRSDSEFYRHLIEHDTAFLVKMETIDYSMLLGRYPIEMFHDKPDPSRHRDPLVLPKKDHFARGARSADGNWVYT